MDETLYQIPKRPKTHRTGLNKPSSHNRRGKRGIGCSKLRDNRWEGQGD